MVPTGWSHDTLLFAISPWSQVALVLSDCAWSAQCYRRSPVLTPPSSEVFGGAPGVVVVVSSLNVSI